MEVVFFFFVEFFLFFVNFCMEDLLVPYYVGINIRCFACNY